MVQRSGEDLLLAGLWETACSPKAPRTPFSMLLPKISRIVADIPMDCRNQRIDTLETHRVASETLW